MEACWKEAREEKILTGHTEAAGSTSEQDLFGMRNLHGSLYLDKKDSHMY